MILTKDNLLRFVREKKYVIPTNVADAFDTSTTIASATLSELSKDKSIAITFFKLSSSPYYYDPKQKECLVEIAEKHFSGYDKDVFKMLKESQVLNDSSLTIQLRLAVERIKDFAIPLEIEFGDKNMKFWVWYLRDLTDTKKQILDVLKPKVEEQNTKKVEIKKEPVRAPIQIQNIKEENRTQMKSEEFRSNPFENPAGGEEESKSELFIENYFKKNYLKLENKNKLEKTIEYNLSLTVNKLKIHFDCIFFIKKPTEAEILKFYTSSQKPKIIFAENAPKKLYKLAENLDNLEIVNI